jgi:hypothetical protein
LQSTTEVTLLDNNTTNMTHNQPQIVTQAYCSALPITYSGHAAEYWQAFATLILEASYEAILCAGILFLVNH